MDARILIADDDETIIRLLTITLRNEGYELIIARDGRAALNMVNSEHPDMAILDVMMPEMTGFEVCHALRAQPETATMPIIILSGLADVDDKVSGIQAGADEYVTKPFSPRVLVARVRALLRRSHGELGGEPTRWRVRELELDADMRTVTMRGQPIELTPSEFGVLHVLIARPDTLGAGLGMAGPVYRDIMSLALPRYGVQPSNDVDQAKLPLFKE